MHIPVMHILDNALIFACSHCGHNQKALKIAYGIMHKLSNDNMHCLGTIDRDCIVLCVN